MRQQIHTSTVLDEPPPPGPPRAHAPARPILDERRAYEPRARQEAFIVPLIKSAVTRAIADTPPLPAAPRALDVGCGGQPLRADLERRGWSYTGLDTQTQPGITLDFLAPIDAPLPDGLLARAPFGLIICTEVLEHVLDWDAAIANIARLLAPGGRAIITAPHFYPLHEEPYDFWRPTLHALRGFAARHGLSVTDARPLGGPAHVLGTLIGALKVEPARPGLLPWTAARLLRKLRKLAFALLRSRIFHRLIHLRGQTYLVNFVILEKPQHPRPSPEPSA